MLFDSIERKQLANWTDDKQATPAITSQVLTRDHLIITSLNGDLILATITVGSDNTAQRIKTPNAKGIGSTPAIADNTIFFGCDDGYLYGYGNGKEIEVITGNIDWITKPRSKITSGTGKQYGWVSSSGDAANNCYVDDLALKPPLKVRWAARYYGHAKSPAVANEGNDVFTVTLQRQLTCHEQTTGRMRWRVCLPPDGIEQRRGAGMALDGNDLVIPTPWGENGKIFCIDITHGKIKWEAPIGDKGTFDRASPIIANSKVAFSYTTKENSIIAAWDLATGAPAWEIKLAVNPGVSANGCAGKDIMYYTAGSEQWRWKPADETRQRGESLAIEASTGKVLWRTHELFGSATPSLDKNDTILMLEIGDGPMSGIKAINVHDGTLKWNAGRTYMTRTSIGNEYAVLRGYGGAAQKINLADGSFSKGLVKGGQLGGDTHACGAVGLTPRYSYAVTVGGLIVRDAETGEQVWQSPGFAPRACVNVSLANGRVFWPSAASGVFFCWEPQRD